MFRRDSRNKFIYIQIRSRGDKEGVALDFWLARVISDIKRVGRWIWIILLIVAFTLTPRHRLPQRITCNYNWNNSTSHEPYRWRNLSITQQSIAAGLNSPFVLCVVRFVCGSWSCTFSFPSTRFLVREINYAHMHRWRLKGLGVPPESGRLHKHRCFCCLAATRSTNKFVNLAWNTR